MKFSISTFFAFALFLNCADAMPPPPAEEPIEAAADLMSGFHPNLNGATFANKADLEKARASGANIRKYPECASVVGLSFNYNNSEGDSVLMSGTMGYCGKGVYVACAHVIKGLQFLLDGAPGEIFIAFSQVYIPQMDPLSINIIKLSDGSDLAFLYIATMNGREPDYPPLKFSEAPLDLSLPKVAAVVSYGYSGIPKEAPSPETFKRVRTSVKLEFTTPEGISSSHTSGTLPWNRVLNRLEKPRDLSFFSIQLPEFGPDHVSAFLDFGCSGSPVFSDGVCLGILSCVSTDFASKVSSVDKDLLICPEEAKMLTMILKALYNRDKWPQDKARELVSSPIFEEVSRKYNPISVKTGFRFLNLSDHMPEIHGIIKQLTEHGKQYKKTQRSQARAAAAAATPAPAAAAQPVAVPELTREEKLKSLRSKTRSGKGGQR